MEDHVKDVKVEVEVNELLTLDGTKQQTMHFKQTGDEVINFKLNVAPKVGIAKVKITATCGKEKAVQIELDVRTPNPKVVDGSEMVLKPVKSGIQKFCSKELKEQIKQQLSYQTYQVWD